MFSKATCLGLLRTYHRPENTLRRVQLMEAGQKGRLFQEARRSSSRQPWKDKRERDKSVDEDLH